MDTEFMLNSRETYAFIDANPTTDEVDIEFLDSTETRAITVTFTLLELKEMYERALEYSRYRS